MSAGNTVFHKETNMWNKPPRGIVGIEPLESFKKQLDNENK